MLSSFDKQCSIFVFPKRLTVAKPHSQRSSSYVLFEKQLSHEIDFKNIDKNLQILA